MDFAKLSEDQKKYALAIADKAREKGVDPDLALAIAYRESQFNPNAIGPVNATGDRAIGLMQVNPPNAAGLKMKVEDLYDPQKNIEAGVQILRDNLDMFGGHTRAALAAYNARPAVAKKYMAKGEDFDALPPETRKYLEDIDALRNTDASGYSRQLEAEPPKTSANKFGELPATEGGEPPSLAPPPVKLMPASRFGEVDENDVMSQGEKQAEGQPPPEPTMYERANTALTDVYKAAKDNPELTGATVAGGATGLMLGKYGADTLDRQTAALEKAKTDLLRAQTQEQVSNRVAKGFTGESSQALDELEQTLAQRRQNLVMHEENLRKLEAELAQHAPVDLKGAPKWTDTVGGEDVPLAQKMQAENYRANNPKGGQAIIDAQTAAKQKLAGMGETGYSLTEPKPGQLALPDKLAEEQKAKALAEQQARNSAALEAQRKAEIARQEVAETERARNEAAKAHQRNTGNASKTAAETRGEVEVAETMAKDAASKAPTGLGKAGVFASKVAGKTLGVLGGISVPLAADEAVKRYNSGDMSGAIISGMEAVSAALAMLPPGTPITAAFKAVGIGGGLAAAILDHFHTKPAAAPAPKGALSQYQEKKPNGITKDAYGRYHG